MKSMPCPKCGTALDITGIAPGSTVACPECDNFTVVSRSGRRKVFLLVAAAVGVVLLCPCVGILAATVAPQFTKSGSRSKQGECKANLKAWYMVQRSYQQEKETYSPLVTLVGFSPERGNRYAYFAGPGPLQDRGSPTVGHDARAVGVGVDTVKRPGMGVTFAQLPPDVASQVGLSGTCPECDILLACAGQLDRDDTLDVWTISTADRQAPDGSEIPRGTPFNHVNDTMD